MGLIKNLGNSKNLMNKVSSSSDLFLELDEEQKQQLKGCLLGMLLDVKDVCEKNNITFLLTGGTALGAVRHKGFIPWDDDIDIAMPRKEYEKFCSVFEKELGDRYILNAPNYSADAKARFPKLLKKGTYMREILDVKNDSLNMIFLDIFILENFPDNQIVKNIKGIYCNALEFISGQVFLFENRDLAVKEFYMSAGRLNYYIRVMLGAFFSLRKSSKWFDRIDRMVRYDKDDTKYYFIPTGRKHYFGECYEKKKVLPVSTVVFEGYEMPTFRDADYCLTSFYGDYMKIPPINQRERHFIREFKLQ